MRFTRRKTRKLLSVSRCDMDNKKQPPRVRPERSAPSTFTPSPSNGGAEDTAPPLGDIAESFYFDSAGVGRGNFIDFERDSDALVVFFYRVIEDSVSLPENARGSLVAGSLVAEEIKIERVVYYSARVRCAQLSGILFSLLFPDGERVSPPPRNLYTGANEMVQIVKTRLE